MQTRGAGVLGAFRPLRFWAFSAVIGTAPCVGAAFRPWLSRRNPRTNAPLNNRGGPMRGCRLSALAEPEHSLRRDVLNFVYL